MPPPIKMQDVKTARQLASDITQSGAKLYDLLENEYTERQERARALRFLDQAASTSGACIISLLTMKRAGSSYLKVVLFLRWNSCRWAERAGIH